MSKRTKWKRRRIVYLVVRQFDRDVLTAFGKASVFTFDKGREKKRMRKFRTMVGKSFKFRL